MTSTEERVGNWSRWGTDDELGALNLITLEVLRDAAHGTGTGKVYPPGRPIQREGVPIFEYRGAPQRLTLTSHRFTSLASPTDVGFAQPGLNLDVVPFVRNDDIAAVDADNAAIEVIPFDRDIFRGVHIELLVKLGVTLIEHLQLSPLAADRCYALLFVAAPLPVIGAPPAARSTPSASAERREWSLRSDDGVGRGGGSAWPASLEGRGEDERVGHRHRSWVHRLLSRDVRRGLRVRRNAVRR